MRTRIPFALALVLAAGLPSPAASTSAAHPGGRSCFSATSPSSGGVWIWGGASQCGVGVVADTRIWTWNGEQWRSREGPPIEPREDALFVNGPAKGVLTLFGGRRDGKASDDVWVHERDAWRRVTAAGGPGAIQHGAAALDPRRERIVVFGGAVGPTRSGKTYEWDGSAWHELDVPGPAPRVGHGMAWSEQDGGVLLYGGFSDDEQFRDLWRWDGAAWKLLTNDGPTVTEGPVVTEADRGIHVVGPGKDPSASTVGAWRWNGESFVPAAAAEPPLRVGAGAVYDRARRVLVLWGGSAASGGPDATLWELDARGWRKPLSRPGEAMSTERPRRAS